MSIILEDVIKNLMKELNSTFEHIEWHEKKLKQYHTRALNLKETIYELERINEENKCE